MDYEEDYEELTPLSPEELELIEKDYTESEIDDPITEVKYLLGCYFGIKKLDPEIEYEEEMKEYSMGVIRSILAEYDIPTDDLEYLFRFVLELEVLKKQYGSDEIFGNGSSDEAKNALSVRVDEFMKEQPEMFCDVDIYNTLFDFPEPYNETPTYKRVLGLCYEDVLSSGTVESLKAMLQLYDEKRPLTEEYIGKAEFPQDSLEEFKEAFKLWTNDARGGKPIKKRFGELKTIIEQKFSSDQELMGWVALQNTQDKAKKFNLVKWASLAISLVFIPILFIITILLVIAWIVVFFTPIGEKINYIREGKEAVKTLK